MGAREYSWGLIRRRVVERGKARWALLMPSLTLTLVIVVCVLHRASAGETESARANLVLGSAVYQRECALCHGTGGKGDGPAARFLNPRPRDFTRGIFKFRSTLLLPTDEDLFRIISQGMPGTLMPSFSYLSEEERWAVVAYIKTFIPPSLRGQPSPPVPIPEPPPQTQAMLTKGRKLYQETCSPCHGSTGTGDGPLASKLTDQWGQPIIPRDFTTGKMKGGSTPKEIYRTLTTGIGGTPMPAYKGAMSDEARWALTYYVLSLVKKAPPPAGMGNPIRGRELFTGIARFKSSGPPCIGCHSVGKLNLVGGGWGPDLSVAFPKFGQDNLTDILSTFPFPSMNPLFHDYPLTEEERTHLIAFLEQASQGTAETRFVPALFTTLALSVVALLILTTISLRASQKEAIP